MMAVLLGKILGTQALALLAPFVRASHANADCLVMNVCEP